MLAVLHGADSHGEVVVPVGSYIYQVDVGTLAQLLVTLFAAVDGCRGQSGITQILLASLGARCFIVTQSHNLYTGDVAEAFHSAWSAHTQTHEAHSYSGHLGSGEAQYILLSGRAGGCFHNDGTFVPMPFGAGAKALCTCTQTGRGGNEYRHCDFQKTFLHVFCKC